MLDHVDAVEVALGQGVDRPLAGDEDRGDGQDRVALLRARRDWLSRVHALRTDVNPPDPVKPAFNEVNQAIQEKERAINDAWADYNKSVPKAKGEADQAIRSAEGYALERVNKAPARMTPVMNGFRRTGLSNFRCMK